MDRIPPQVITGAGMDTVLPRRRRFPVRRAGVAALALGAAAAALWFLLPRGLAVPERDVRLAAATRGTFNDDVAVRASAQPLHSVILDAVESGRVEEVVAHDGQLVKKGELLFRLSNPQRNLELLARQTERAQQISNLSNLRVTQEASRTDHERRLADLQFALEQARKQHARNEQLAARGFISSVALEESRDKLAQAAHNVDLERSGGATDERVRRAALGQMETAIAGIDSGLKLVAATVDALAVRAPVDGKLTGFRLQVGETVKPDQNIGRIDDPDRFKLSAEVDEYYLGRMTVGRRGLATLDGQSHPIEISTIYPQIKDGRFTVELVFRGPQPALSPGQSLNAQITLGQPAPALLLPSGAFLNETGGSWVFVVDRAGNAARRAVRLGRRSASQVEIVSGLAEGDRVIVSSYAAFGKSERLQLSK